MKIVIVGLGNGVVIVVVDMVDKGYDVWLYCCNEFISKFDVVLEKGGFDFYNEGEEKFIEFIDISDDMEYVLDGVDIV